MKVSLNLNPVYFRNSNIKKTENKISFCSTQQGIQNSNLQSTWMPVQSVDMTHYTERKLYSVREFENLLLNNKSANRYLGNISADWVDKNMSFLEYKEKSDTIKEVISKFAENTHTIKGIPTRRFEPYIKILEKELSETTGKNTSVNYLAAGEYGKVFKLNINNKDYVLKTFHNVEDDPEYGYYSKAGKGAEILNASYANKNADKGDFIRFYFGKFAKERDHDGFMLVEYIHPYSGKVSEFKNPILKTITRYLYIPMPEILTNRYKDTVFDFGHMDSRKELANPEKRKMVNDLCLAIDKNDLTGYRRILANNKNSKHLDDSIAYIKKALQEHGIYRYALDDLYNTLQQLNLITDRYSIN